MSSSCGTAALRTSRLLVRLGAVLIAVSPAGWLFALPSGDGQCPKGVVLDTTGAAMPEARVIWYQQMAAQQVLSAPDGTFVFACRDNQVGGVVRAEKTGLTSDTIPAGSSLQIVVKPTALAQAVTVSATRGDVTTGPEAQSLVVLDAANLRAYPALTLDEKLRQVAGLDLFRRTSSWAANPTTEGISLRGLGSTAASRSLVLAGGVPLNDGFGGWVHWDELPPDAIQGVSVAKGGGSDLYGSSALGGVVDLIPAQPGPLLVSAALSGAAEDTTDGHGRVDLSGKRWGVLLGGEGFRTAGYVPIAPGLVGAVDRPANVHFQNGRLQVDRQGVAGGKLSLGGNLLNEARGNGTTVQTNGTRLWRWFAGDEWTAGAELTGRARVFGSEESYRQSFSSINAPRSLETLTRLQGVTTQEVGGSADATVGGRGLAVVFGADLRDLRANDVERPFAGGVRVSSIQTNSARQRFTGGFVEGLASRGGWSGAASVRVDSSVNLDTKLVTFTPGGDVTAGTQVPYRSEVLVSPRVGVVRQLPRGWQVHGEGFRAFRAPTMNELYRTGQVGQETTLPNVDLRSERGTGAEGGARWASGVVQAEASYFWTEINRPVSAVLLRQSATAITNLRENLGQIQSQGADVRVRLFEERAVSGAVGYQYAHAVVTGFSAQPGLIGNWIPNVPRQSVTGQMRARRAGWGEVTVAMRAAGRAYDDSSNLFPLRRFVSVDVYGQRELGRGWSAFVSVQNVFNQRAEVARTPLLTLGNPVLAQGGVRFGWGGREDSPPPL